MGMGLGIGLWNSVAAVSGGGGAPSATLSAASGTTSSPTASALKVTSDTGSGTWYWVVPSSGGAPTAAQIIAGQDASGTGLGAGQHGSQAVSATGIQSGTASAAALDGLTAYSVQVTSGNSNIVSAVISWQPNALAGLFMQLEADPTQLFTNLGTTAVTSDGQAVEQVNDKSGNGHNVTQTTLANRPLYKTDLAKPSLLFDGSNDFLSTASGLALTDGSGQYWHAVSARFDSHTANQFVLRTSGAAFVGGLFMDTSARATQQTADTGATVLSDSTSATFTDGTACVVMATVTTTAVEAFIDNASNGSTALSVARQSNVAQMTIGASTGGASPTNGRIFGVICGTGVLSSSDRGKLQTYMAALHP